MAEKLTALAGRLGPPIALALATAVFATALVIALGVAVYPLGTSALTTATAPLSTAAGTEQCYAWDVLNTTGVDADGLNIHLAGVQTLTSVYTGEANPLGGARLSSGYDASTSNYVLNLGTNAVTVGAGESVRVGVCTPGTVAAAQMQWLAGASAVGAALNPPAVTWRWLSFDEVQVQVKNTSGTPVTVVGLRLLAPETALAIDDLDGAVAANLDAAAAELEEPILLAPNAAFASALPLAPEGPGRGEPLLLAIEWAEGDDLLAAATAYIATSVATETRTYLPAIRR